MMSDQIRSLEPAALWQHFADLNAIPRPSKKEEKIREFMLSFGKKLGLETLSDSTGNVLIRKAASPGMENRQPVILQAHLDMVHQKNADTEFDFETQGIDMVVEAGWVKARGTTLGADNGIGVAAIMAVLSSNQLIHPPVEALFTIDEETGMTGAKGLEGGWLKGNVLLNLDTEEDDELDIGCAGGLDLTAELDYTEEFSGPEGMHFFQLSVSGLKGGHSGIDIHLGRANANKLLARILWQQDALHQMRLISLEGGSLRNAIPRESQAWVAVPTQHRDAFLATIQHRLDEIHGEFRTIEPAMNIQLNPAHSCEAMVPVATQRKICLALMGAHNGVYRMSPTFSDLVEASNNVAKVQVSKGKAVVMCLIRSSVESTKTEVANALQSVFSLADFSVHLSGDYPGWTPNADSPLLAKAKSVFQSVHGSEPRIVACHAGLECGILAKNYPGMDMVSFGPTIQGAHSPDEKVNIDSVSRFWTYLQVFLAEIH